MAMVPSGPMPGSTPISVPTVTPIRQYSRFCSESATPKPKIRLLKRSMTASVEAREQRIGQAQRPDEHHSRERSQAYREHQHLDEFELAAGGRRAEDQHQHRRHEAAVLHEHPEQDQRERQDDERTQ